MNNDELIPHLFRTEYRKIVSVLSRYFGFDQIEIAEDIASETFLTATHTWGLSGLPANPATWLYTVAKNKAKIHLQRSLTFNNKVLKELKHVTAAQYEIEIDLSAQNISDSQLQMMFAICHPAISPETQIGLSLRILCGFGIEEIADAFITNKETINKRLFRGKEKLRNEKVKIAIPGPSQINERIETVLTTIYLMFNEGYYSISQNKTLRKELCLEAIRLCTMLIENKETNKPQVNALLALMCFHTSRFDARIDKNGENILYEDQDTRLWNADLINKGGYFLSCSSSGDQLTKYHIEAGIAYWNTQKADTVEKWEQVLLLYNQLLQIAYSPIAALNRTYAYSKVHGKVKAIVEAEKLALTGMHFYYALLGELYTNVDPAKAKENYQLSLSLVKTDTERLSIQKKIDQL
jgi:RNA polymerase sigma factor (sigma-70 family)